MQPGNRKELEAYERIIHHLKVLNEVRKEAEPEEKEAVTDILFALFDLRDCVHNSDDFMASITSREEIIPNRN